MEDKMPNQEEHKFINLSKPVSDLYQDYNTQPVNYNGYNDNQQDIMPEGYTNNNFNSYFNQQDTMPNQSGGFNPQAYQSEIYPQQNTGTPSLYKEVNIPQSSFEMPKVQPAAVNPPVVQNNPVMHNQTAQQTQTKFCKYCGQKIHSDAVICPHCGRQVEQLKNNPNASYNNVYINNAPNNSAYPMPISPYSKNTALLLSCLGLIGLGGIHRLYSGKYASGILYLLTGGLFYIGTIVDIIRIAQGDFRDKNGFQLKE